MAHEPDGAARLCGCFGVEGGLEVEETEQRVELGCDRRDAIGPPSPDLWADVPNDRDACLPCCGGEGEMEIRRIHNHEDVCVPGGKGGAKRSLRPPDRAQVSEDFDETHDSHVFHPGHWLHARAPQCGSGESCCGEVRLKHPKRIEKLSSQPIPGGFSSGDEQLHGVQWAKSVGLEATGGRARGLSSRSL